MSKEKNFVSAIVYVRNAEKSIEKFLSVVTKELTGNFEHSEIICVNDSSNDDSARIIREFAKDRDDLPEITILNMSFFHGLEVAMNAGCDLAIGDFVFEFDTPVVDYDGSEIMNVYKKSLEGFDVVSASANRKERGSSKMFYKIFDKYTDLSYQMHTETFRIISRRMINRVLSMNHSVPYRKVLYASSGLKSANLVYAPLSDSKTVPLKKEEKKYRKGLATESLILFTKLGYSASFALTIFMMAVAIIVAIYSVVIFAVGHPVEGWTTTILFLAVAFFGLFAILTIVLKYLQVLVDLIFKRKKYNFEGIERL